MRSKYSYDRTFASKVLEELEVPSKEKLWPNLDKKKFDREVQSKLLALRCSDPAERRSNWALRLLRADKIVILDYVDSISYKSVRQILRKRK